MIDKTSFIAFAFRVFVMIWVLTAAGSVSVQAQSPAIYSVFHNFGATLNSGTDGQMPESAVTVDSSGNVFGTTSQGGANSKGMVWKITTSGTFTNLHDFGGTVTNADDLGGPDGSEPYSGVTFDSFGNIYGVTTGGGANGGGMVWEITSSGAYEDLYDFSGSDGWSPEAGVMFDSGGNMYGTTMSGGANDSGEIWEISSAGSFSVLHSFGGSATNANGTTGADGINPYAAVKFDSSGNMYGTATYGGANNEGIIWEITSTGAYKDLHDFGGMASNSNGDLRQDGKEPYSEVALDSSGNMYGTASTEGEYDQGMVWELTAGGTYTDLHDFGGTVTNASGASGTDGESPYAGVSFDNSGNMFGSAYYGGANGDGVVWEIDKSGTYKDLHDFGGTEANVNGATESDGSWPNAVTIDSSGDIFGSASTGGANSDGLVYRLGYTDKAQIMWRNSNNELAITDYNVLKQSGTTNTYGPYAGWTPRAIATGQDSLTRVLWTNTNGAVSIWTLDDGSGEYTYYMAGPFASWTAVGIAVGQDNITHVLWRNTSGAISVWNIDGSGSSGYSYFAFGPFTGWSCNNIAIGFDNIVHLLWRNASGATSVYNVNPSNPAGYDYVIEYNTSGWSLVGFDEGEDGLLQLFWTNNSDNTGSGWSLDTIDNINTTFRAGPFSGWTLVSAAESASQRHALWYDASSGVASLWNLNSSGSYSSYQTLTAPSGFTPIMMSARH